MTATQITAEQITAAIASLTPKGRDLMTNVGMNRFSYFDDGITQGSGIWGNCLAPEMGVSARSASGIMVGTQKAGMWGTTEDAQDGTWWYLTDLGAAVANALAEAENAQHRAPEVVAPVITTKVGAKWTYIYSDGSLIAEVRTDSAAAVIAALSA